MKKTKNSDWASFCMELADLMHKHSIGSALILGFCNDEFRNTVLGLGNSNPRHNDALNKLSDGVYDFLKTTNQQHERKSTD